MGLVFLLVRETVVAMIRPTAGALASLLANRCGWPYDDEDLSVVYAQAQFHLGSESLFDQLSELYQDCTPAEWHLLVAKLCWYRIFTTNIDDVIENSYRTGGSQSLQTITCPAPFLEQDQFYDRLQCVHLHGYVIDRSKTLTFTPQEMAEQTAKPNPWYQTMIADMLTKSFIFVGTRLSDPPFHHYLSMRSEREKGVPENRAKAFLVSPGITPIYRRQFEDQNFVVVDATAEEFFHTLVPAVLARIPTRLDLLRNRYPHQISAITQGTAEVQTEVLRQFELVSGDAAPPDRRARIYFYDGAEATWDDIRRHVDADREITNEFSIALSENTEGIQVFRGGRRGRVWKDNNHKAIGF